MTLVTIESGVVDSELIKRCLQQFIDGIEDLDRVEEKLGLDLRNLVELLAKYRHNDDIHHNGETILEHIEWVVQDVARLTKTGSEQRVLLMTTAFLHDLGKAYTHEMLEGRHIFYDHAKVSVIIAEEMTHYLWTTAYYQPILDLIRLHDVFMQLIEAHRTSGSLRYLNRFVREPIYRDGYLDFLVTFTKADAARARRLPDTLEGIEGVLADIKEVERQKREEATARARRDKLSPKDEAAIRHLLEAEAPHVVQLLPDLKEVNRMLGQEKRYDLLQRIRKLFS